MLSPEEFCDNVEIAMQAGIQAALDAQTAKWAARDAAAGRTIDLQAPRPEDYYIGGVPTVLRYPTIEIAVPDFRFDNLSLGNYDGDAHPRLLIRALFQLARDPEWLYRMGCRWFAAVTAVVAVPGALGPVDIDESAGFSGSWRFNPETNTQDEVQSGVLCTYNLLGPLNTFAA